jgi:tetratricopeptide (TPR) repeat protein
MPFTRLSRPAAFLAALLVLGAVTGVAVGELNRHRQAAGEARSPVYLPQAKYLRPMSLGYENVLADILWFRAISYFGKHYRQDRTYPWLAHMCDLVTDLDPKARHVYQFAGVILPWEANQAEAGIRMLEKGVRVFPESWILRYHLGFNYYFFENDYDKAIENLKIAAQLPGVHPTVAELVAVLAQHRYGPETTLKFLSELEGGIYSDEVRDVVRQQMKEARLAVRLEHIGDAVERYRKRTGRIPASAETLVEAGLLTEVPEDPFGGSWKIDPETGKVRSSTGQEPSRLHQSRAREQVLRGEPVR